MNGRKGEPDKRGSVIDRLVRPLWLLWKFGDGVHCPCHHCGVTLSFTTVTSDRIDNSGPGGPYRRDAIWASCWECNEERGTKPVWTYTGPPRDPAKIMRVRSLAEAIAKVQNHLDRTVRRGKPSKIPGWALANFSVITGIQF